MTNPFKTDYSDEPQTASGASLKVGTASDIAGTIATAVVVPQTATDGFAIDVEKYGNGKPYRIKVRGKISRD